MKIRIAGAILLLTGVLLFIRFSSHAMKEGTIEESIIVDKTDSFTAIPTAPEVLAPLHIEDEKWSRVSVRIQSLSNLDYNKSVEIHLPPRIALLSSPDERKKEIDVFKQHTASAIDSINRIKSGKSKSSIYRSIISEVNRLAAINSRKKKLIIYSDLLEHAHSFSLYDGNTQRQLEKTPQQIKLKLEQIAKPTGLRGIDIYFIFIPKSDSENDLFMAISKIYKSILEDAGANVLVEANLSGD